MFQHRKKVESAEQWCFSIRENDEGLLAMVFQQRKRKGETIARRSCFVDEEMVDCSVLGVGRKKVLNNGVSASRKKSIVLNSCFPASEGER